MGTSAYLVQVSNSLHFLRSKTSYISNQTSSYTTFHVILCQPNKHFYHEGLGVGTIWHQIPHGWSINIWYIDLVIYYCQKVYLMCIYSSLITRVCHPSYIPNRIENDCIVFCRRSRSQSCPFCRDSLKRVNSGDLWVFTDTRDVVDMATLTKENLRRLFMYIEKLPLIVPESLFDAYDSHLKWHLKLLRGDPPFILPPNPVFNLQSPCPNA